MTGDESRAIHATDRAHVIRRWIVRALALVSAAVLIAMMVLGVVITRAGAQDSAQHADVIIVLGGGDEGTLRRATHGAALYARGYAPFVLCTGAVEIGGLSEARHCAQALIALGVPEAAIVLEEHSHNTEENAIESRAIMAREGWQSAVLVSDEFHLWRAGWLYRERGITVYSSPAQITTGSLDVFESAHATLRELVAIAWQVGKWLVGRAPVLFIVH